jgi:hypothetical protein
MNHCKPVVYHSISVALMYKEVDPKLIKPDQEVKKINGGIEIDDTINRFHVKS